MKFERMYRDFLDTRHRISARFMRTVAATLVAECLVECFHAQVFLCVNAANRDIKRRKPNNSAQVCSEVCAELACTSSCDHVTLTFCQSQFRSREPSDLLIRASHTSLEIRKQSRRAFMTTQIRMKLDPRDRGFIFRDITLEHKTSRSTTGNLIEEQQRERRKEGQLRVSCDGAST